MVTASSSEGMKGCCRSWGGGICAGLADLGPLAADALPPFFAAVTICACLRRVEGAADGGGGGLGMVPLSFNSAAFRQSASVGGCSSAHVRVRALCSASMVARSRKCCAMDVVVVVGCGGWGNGKGGGLRRGEGGAETDATEKRSSSFSDDEQEEDDAKEEKKDMAYCST